jgi:hypothetical protein
MRPMPRPPLPWRLRALTLSAATLGLAAGAANAQEATPAETPTPEPTRPAPVKTHPRELNGHYFIPSNVAVDPFTATYFGSQTGFGYLSATVPDQVKLLLGSGGQSPTVTVPLLPVTQGFGLQIGILPRFWALRVSATGIAVVPASGDGAASYGSRLGYDISGGTTLSFRIANVLRIGAVLDVDYGSFYLVQFGPTLQALRRTGQLDTSSLVVNRNLTTVSGRVALALAPHRLLGLTAAAQYVHTFLLQGDLKSDSGALGFTAALDLDLRAVSPIPIGLIGSYAFLAQVQDTSLVTHQIGAGIYYTGRRNLVLGPEAQVFLPTAGNGNQQILYGVITLRYYW